MLGKVYSGHPRALAPSTLWKWTLLHTGLFQGRFSFPLGCGLSAAASPNSGGGGGLVFHIGAHRHSPVLMNKGYAV